MIHLSLLNLEYRLQEVADVDNCPIVASGDFNQVPDDELDRSWPSCNSKRSVHVSNDFCIDLGLMSFSSMETTVQDYMIFSAQVLSRIYEVLIYKLKVTISASVGN